MKLELIVLGMALIGMTYAIVGLFETLQMHTLNEQAETLTRTVRLQYPRIMPGECPLWDRIRYDECEEEYRD